LQVKFGHLAALLFCVLAHERLPPPSTLSSSPSRPFHLVCHPPYDRHRLVNRFGLLHLSPAIVRFEVITAKTFSLRRPSTVLECCLAFSRQTHTSRRGRHRRRVPRWSCNKSPSRLCRDKYHQTLSSGATRMTYLTPRSSVNLGFDSPFEVRQVSPKEEPRQLPIPQNHNASRLPSIAQVCKIMLEGRWACSC
jgi:hypothetical protein